MRLLQWFVFACLCLDWLVWIALVLFCVWVWGYLAVCTVKVVVDLVLV